MPGANALGMYFFFFLHRLWWRRKSSAKLSEPIPHPRLIRAFSGKVGTGFPQKMRQSKNLGRFPQRLNRKAI
jgi:hypothetical protein